MQPNQLVLHVDTLNDGTTVVDETFTRYEELPNRTRYVGEDHLPDDRNELSIYRTFPTRNGNFKGTAKSSVKFTKDFEVPGVDSSTTLTSPVIVEVSFSVPVGISAADLLLVRQRLIAALDDDSFMDPLNIQLMV